MAIIVPMAEYQGKRLLLSGPSGSGKTSVCLKVIQSAQRSFHHIDGVISPGLFVDGHKEAIMVQAVSTGETRLLASPMRSVQLQDDTSLRTPAWSFDPAAVAWGNQILASALPTDLFMIDELGPLEWLQNKGWTAAFNAIDSRMYRLCILVTRPELLDMALNRWPDAGVLNISSPLDVPRLYDLILNLLLGTQDA